MKITLRCYDTDYNAIDRFLNLQEFNEKPIFEFIDIITENNVYYYKVIKEFNHWYIVIE